ncbi:MAG: hypothetical protein AAF085_00090 [Planctomycetota bacterium]
MSDLFPVLLDALDDVGRVFDHGDTSRWSSELLATLLRLDLIRESSTGLYAPCLNCDGDHVEKVTRMETPEGMKFWIHCPLAMRIYVTEEMCRGWVVHPAGVAMAIASAIGIKAKPKEVSAGRLWRLGRTQWKQSTREVLLATRLDESDAPSIAAHVGPGGRAIVFVPRDPPDDRLWPGRVPAVVSLSRVAKLHRDGISLDVPAMMELVADADAAAEACSLMPIDPEVKKQVIRRQVKAEIKGHLEDDILIAAWKMHGSVRLAAAALTEQLDRTVTKDAVQRALKRAGGAKALREADDTPAVARNVASQSRDKGKSFIERR